MTSPRRWRCSRAAKFAKFATPPIGEVEDDTGSFDHPRIWRDFATEEWRTNYPPPPGFTGFEQDDWEGETYCRALSDEELATLIVAGIAKPAEAATVVTIEQDEEERQAFFAALAKPIIRHPGLDPGSALSGDATTKADAGSMNRTHHLGDGAFGSSA